MIIPPFLPFSLPFNRFSSSGSLSTCLLLPPSSLSSAFKKIGVRGSEAEQQQHPTQPMKDFISCFSEHAVRVSDVACSGSSGGGSSSAPLAEVGSVRSAVTAVYRGRLCASKKELLVLVTWTKTHDGPSLSVAVDDLSSSRRAGSHPATTQVLHRKKGSRTFAAGSCIVGVFWDFSSARYRFGPEPASEFYVVVNVDSEFVLLLGDMGADYVKKSHGSPAISEEFSMVCLKEQVLFHAFYSTKARFRVGGLEHDIAIRCGGGGGGGRLWDARDLELTVCIDQDKVVCVKRLRWNFRGNQEVFVDGLQVDLMWDVHDWWFGGGSGCAVFLFRPRSRGSEPESCLWLEEEEEQGKPGLSLMIQAFKQSACRVLQQAL